MSINRVSWIMAFFLVFTFSAMADVYDPNHVQVYLVPLDDFPEPLSVQLAKALSDDLGNSGDSIFNSTYACPQLGPLLAERSSLWPADEADLAGQQLEVLRSLPVIRPRDDPGTAANRADRP